jgi:pyocin large subunit-like protein
VITSSESLHKIEAEDGDDIYFLESTEELVILSKDGYIRTYFKPEDGIDYFNRQ